MTITPEALLLLNQFVGWILGFAGVGTAVGVITAMTREGAGI